MTAKLTTRSPWGDFLPVIMDREPFKTSGALYAEKDGYVSYGRLDNEYRESASKADYVIYSYGTPIAWHGPDGWNFPDEKYSVTTSRHQSKIFFIKDWIDECND